MENITKIHDELLPVIKSIGSANRDDLPGTTSSKEVIFVDDGSHDGTSARLKEIFGGEQHPGLTYKFLKHEKNMGLGAAIRTGFSNAEGEIIITVDSDATYKFSEIPTLLTTLTPDVDIVTASPYHPNGGVQGVPADRLILSRGSSLIYRLLVDPRIYTYTCLFRAYRSSVVKSIPFHSNDFLAGTEILVKALFSGFRVAELPAILHRRQYGVSKARIARTIYSHLGFQIRILVYRFLSFLRLADRKSFWGVP